MKNLSLLLLSFLFLFSCGNDDEPDDMNNQSSAIMEVEKDGILYTVTTFNNTLISDTQGEFTGKRLDLRGNVDGGTFILTVSNWEWQDPPTDGVIVKSYDTNIDDIGPNTVCQETTAATYCDGALGTWFVGNTTYISENVDNAGAGVITISENDPSERTVSGSFDFKTSFLLNDSIIEFKGTFDNLSY